MLVYLDCEIVPRMGVTQADTFTLLHSTWCLAAAIGPVVGGSLAAQGKWRWLFCTCDVNARNVSRHSVD